MKPYPYQEEDIQKILLELETEERLCYTLATGGGKTALFSFLAKYFIGDSNKRVLILADRTKLISQTINTLFNIGVRSEAVYAKKKHLMHSAQVYVAMIETIFKRVEKNPYFVPAIDLIIVDECHKLAFIKLFAHFPNVKILGVTATPAVTITETTNRDIGHGEVMEYNQKFGLHYYYKKLIEGPEIQFVIDLGVIVPEIVFWEDAIKRDELVIDELKGEFKPENNRAGKMCAVTNYEKFCKGKKTIIFTASTKENLSLLADFRDKGYGDITRIYDSVNKVESGDQDELLKWYENTPDAILINTGVFTTGFDEPTIQSVILALSTASLSKYHQMVGRGGRSTKKIYKPNFILIDLGGNVAAFGKWSDPVDWSKHFYYESKLVPKKEALEKIAFCEGCNQIIAATAVVCPFCGHEKEKKIVSLTKSTVHVSELIYPSGTKIVKYCDLHKQNKKFAVNIMLKQAVDLFIYAEVSKALFESTVKNGNFFKHMEKILNEEILIIQSSSLAGNYEENHIVELVSMLHEHYNKC